MNKLTSVGSVEYVPFMACASGSELIILASDFTILQKINIEAKIDCLDCSNDGKIAVSHNDIVTIYETITSDQQWNLSATIPMASHITSMSFDSEGKRLIVGGDGLYLWSLESNWQCIWQYKLARQISYLEFSPDGTLFASASTQDSLVRIWFQRNESYSFIYLPHPAQVIGFEWRHTNKCNNKGAIANVLVTSCEDNVSRIWVQDLYNYAQLYNGDCMQQKLMLLNFHLAGAIETCNTNGTPQSQFIVHWINNKHDNQSRISPTTNSPGESCSGSEIDTENVNDTITAESGKKLRHKLCSKVNKQRALAASLGTNVLNSQDLDPTGRSTPCSDDYDKMDKLQVKKWQSTADVIYSLNKEDGSIQSWQVKYLDEEDDGLFRHVQIDKLTKTDSALSHYYATTMSLNISTYATSPDELFLVTQHLSGVLGLWKMTYDHADPTIHSIDLITRITGLPIDPAWMQDGILSVEYNERIGALHIEWFTNNESDSDNSLIRASEIAANINLLPQYHVNQLIELLAFGKLQRVKAILNNCLKALTQLPIQEDDLDYVEVSSIKPLSLFELLEADNEKEKKEIETATVRKTNKREEFSMQDFESFYQQRTEVDETLDEILGKTTLDTLNRQKSLKRKKEAALDGSLTSFNPSKAKLLTRVLTHTHLPGLSNVDQMHLLAVADAIALFDASPSDYEDMQEEDGGYGANHESGMGVVNTNIAIDSLDDRGLRFLTAMRQHVYLTRCLPIKQRAELQATGIGNHNLVWAFHSETQDELVSLIPCVNRNKPQWAELREYGIGWWLKKIEVLRKLIEKVAQSAYQARQDPLDAALFYLAMKKKTLVCALLRRVNCDKRLLKLFEQDFNDPTNRKKALKNAYALLGLHRFEHAAAFFILAGSIWDAVEVCINNLNDIQLAIVLIRLHDTDSNVPPNFKKLLLTEILGPTEHPDPFLRSMAFWILRDYLSSVHTLLDLKHQTKTTTTATNTNVSQDSTHVRHNHGLHNTSTLLSSFSSHFSVSANVFNFYLFLKEQPLVIKHKQQLIEEAELKRRASPIEEEQVHSHRARSLSSGELTFDEQALTRAVRQSSTEFEVLNEIICCQADKYSDEAIAKKERLLFFSTAYSYLNAGCPLLALEVLCKEDHLNLSNAQRMKFIACLHILMNELNTVVEVNQTTPTKTTIHQWLIKNINAMKSICSYEGIFTSDQEKGDDDDDDWVKQNEPLLRTMLTYCNLHSANENSLTIVRLELLSLLQEQQQQQQPE